LPVIPTWKDENSLLFIELGASASQGKPNTSTSLKELSRGRPLASAKTILAPEESAGIDTFLYARKGGSSFFIAGSNAAGTSGKYWKLTPDNKTVPLPLPKLGGIGVAFHAGQWIFKLGEDWVAHGKAWKAGSLISIDDDEIARSSPRARLLMEPGPRETIDTMGETSDGLLIISHLNVRGRLSRFSLSRTGWERKEIGLPDLGTVAFAMHGGALSSGTLVKFESFLNPPAIYNVDVALARYAAQEDAAAVRWRPARYETVRGNLEEQDSHSLLCDAAQNLGL
jgi:prolyl oligopeptidase PreP (S9A serine peptidase family)